MIEELKVVAAAIGGAAVGGLTFWVRASHARKQVSGDTLAVRKNDTEVTLLGQALVEREECLRRERETTKMRVQDAETIAALNLRVALKNEKLEIAAREIRRLRRELEHMDPDNRELKHSDFLPFNPQDDAK